MKFAELLARYMEEDTEIFAESLDYHRLKVIIKNSTSEKSFLVVLSDEVLRLKGVYEGRTWAMVHQAEAILKKSTAVSAATVDAFVQRAIRIENFFHLNSSGIRKICKKFIKYVSSQHLPSWEDIGKPFLSLGGVTHGRLTFLVSQLYQRCATTAPAPPPAAPFDNLTGNQTTFVIPEGRMQELVLKLARRAQLYVHDKEATVANENISTVYYDTPQLDAYNQRSAAGSTSLLRVRFYGKLKRDGNVFVEYKTHEVEGNREGGGPKEGSEKERFSLPFIRVHQFLSREWDPVPYLNSIIDGKEEVEEAKSLALLLQEKVTSQGLIPVVRVVHDRMAFEMLDKGNIVRIKVDSQILFAKEDGNPKQWIKDLNEIAPVFRIKHAIIEVTTPGEIPADILKIIKSVEPMEISFSKYRTGCAVHYVDTVSAPQYFTHPSIASVVKAYFGEIKPDLSESVSNFSSDGERSPNRSGTPHRSPTLPPRAPPPRPPPPIAPAAPPAQTRPVVAVAPMRIEPKTYFANERTFLHWQHQSMLILLLGTSMLSYHPLGMQELYTGCGFVVMLIGTLTILYSLHRFYWRLRSIETGDREGYIDRYGPPFVSLFIFVAVCVVLAAVLSSGDNVVKNPLKATAPPMPMGGGGGGGTVINGLTNSPTALAESSPSVTYMTLPLYKAQNSLLDPVLDAFGAFVLQTKVITVITTGLMARYLFPGDTTAIGLVPLPSLIDPTVLSVDVLTSSKKLWRCVASSSVEGKALTLQCDMVPPSQYPRIPATVTAATWHNSDSLIVAEDGGRSLTYLSLRAGPLPLPISGSPIRTVTVIRDILTLYQGSGDAFCLAEYSLETGAVLSKCVKPTVAGARTMRPSGVSDGNKLCISTTYLPSAVYNEIC